MKRSILIFVSLFVLLSYVMAEPVDSTRALQVAKQFIPQYSSSAKKVPKKGAATEAADIVYTHKMPKSGRDAFYIVNVDDAFVLVTADDIAHQILGYSFDKGFPVNVDGTIQLPPHVKGFFDDLAAQIEVAVDAEPNRAPSEDWSGERKIRRAPSSLPESVDPLLTTTWDQGQYYNALCPEDVNGPAGHVWTGCIATAMAQIIKYWGEPVHGRGTHSYDSNYGTLEVDFTNSNYDFENMPDVLTGECSEEQINAVAKLIYDCGVAVNMGYGAGESGAFDQEARAGLINFFRFSANMSFAEKAYFSNEEWENLLRQNLAANRPVYYSGKGTGGHAFVCDGYKTDDYYHFNFGWGGFADGWFLTSAVTPNDREYSSSQSAIVNIVPDNTGNVILGQMQGTSTFIVDEPLEFYHLMGHNQFEGSNYSNSCYNTVSFFPADDAKQMVADIMEFEDQNIQFFDDTDTNNSLRSLNGGGNIDMSPIVSSANALTLTYWGNMYYAGFKLIISQNNGCRMVSNIITSVDTTTVHLMWTENGTATQWQIEYGEEGFTHGNGTTILVNSTTADISFPQRLTKYDVYIRSVCGNNNYGSWSKIPIQTEAPYWQDMIVSQPKSYTIDPISNYAIISSAEDFVWFTQTAQPYDSAYFISDIDLGEYKWRPVSNLFTAYTIKGNGHRISNLYINEISNLTALFSYFNGTIENLGIENAQIHGSGATACFCGKTFIYGKIQNCYISNSIIEGIDQVGGLVAQNNGTIKNCYVNVNIKGNRWNGLLTALSDGTIINSYAVGSVSMRSFCYNGGISAYANSGTISNCYSIDLYPFGVIGYKGQTVISDTASFYLSDVTWTLRTPIDFDGILEDNLLEAMNNGVIQRNDSTLRLWRADTANNGLPKFGDYFMVKCPNVANLTVKNVKVGNISGVVVDWDETGNADNWEIKYQPRHTPADSAIVVNTNNVPDTIYGIPLGREYVFSVRSVRDDDNHSGWATINAMVDLPYWTDIVTMQPEGFTEDADGNVTISSAEGLVWLSVLVNGLHGNQEQTFEGKTITLITDVNLQGYQWYPIGRGLWDNIGGYGFAGTFLGNNHTISNLYVNSTGMCLGLFGCAHSGASFSDITLNNGNVISYGGQRMECIGGLLGLGLQIQSIDNCHSNINVTGVKGVGSLCGKIEVNGQPITPKITNCSASGDVYGREDCGGFIGWIQQSKIMNCFSTGDVYIRDGDSFINLGGFIGLLGESSVHNCYSTGTVGDDLNNNIGGSIIGAPQDNITVIRNVYGLKNDRLPSFGLPLGDIADTSSFVNANGYQVLLTPITINDSTYNSLLNVLNGWVQDKNDTRYKTWVRDSTNTNGGYPVFGNYYEPSCYNPSNVSITNATIVGDTTIRTQIAWEQGGNPVSWEVLYVEAGQDVDSGTIVAVNSNPCILTDLPVGHLLDFYVRAICNDEDTSGWSDAMRYIPDKLRWTEVVTSQPTSYRVDNRDVYVSCAEDLAWLSSVMNGLNGNNGDFYPTRIIFTSDINLSNYRWTAIEYLDSYGCVIEGNGHAIKGLYCNENSNNQGLFGRIYGCTINNLIVMGSRIYGLSNNGTLAGELNNSTIRNCIINGEVYGTCFSGGIVGKSEGPYGELLYNSAFIGNVNARQDVISHGLGTPGYFGGIVGEQFSVKVINSYVTAKIPPYPISHSVSSGAIAGRGSGTCVYNNVYAIHNPINPYLTANNTETNSSFFTGSDTTWTLSTPPYIGDSFYTDLVDALNAWVDANNSEGQYRHWMADTDNVNDGFPVFAPLYTLTYKVDDEIYKTNWLEAGVALPAVEEPTKDGYVFGGWSEIPETMPDHDVEVTGTFYLYGDVNIDTKVNVVDVVDIARYVVDTPSENFRMKLADLNKDLAVNIADAVVLVNHIAGDQNFVKAELPISSLNDYESSSLGLQYGEMNDLSLCLTGNMDFTAFQFEIDVPEGMDISAMHINGLRKDGHQLLFNKVGAKRYRVAALSLSNAVFKGNDGELLNINLEGTGMEDICIHDIHFVTRNGTDVRFDNLYINGTETGIADIHDEGNRPVYDLQGRRRSTLQRGVNIVGGKKMIVR